MKANYFQDEVDLGNDISATLEYDDSVEAYEAEQRLLESANDMGYLAIRERGGHIVHVLNTPYLKELGITIQKN
jgi:hypothetical protein